jgi:hypothetical protein
MRASVATASSAHNPPVAAPSRPLWPMATAADVALISTAPQAPPAMNCQAINVSSEVAVGASAAASAPPMPPAAITRTAPWRLAAHCAGTMSTPKPIQNTGVSFSRSAGCANRRYSGAEFNAKCNWKPRASKPVAPKNNSTPELSGCGVTGGGGSARARCFSAHSTVPTTATRPRLATMNGRRGSALRSACAR